jgi:hypothetical protein
MRIIRLDPNIKVGHGSEKKKLNSLLDEITFFLSTDGIMCEFNYNYATATAIYVYIYIYYVHALHYSITHYTYIIIIC